MLFKRFKNNMPNALTFLRGACALALFFFEPSSQIFIALYLVAGISDILDGYLARKWNLASRLGAVLDSIADFILVASLLCIFVPRYDWPPWAGIWILFIALIRFCSLFVCFFRFGKWAFLHTYSNKAAGFLLLCFPILIRLVGLIATTILLCSVALVSAIEEFIILVYSVQLNRDVSSVFVMKNPSGQDGRKD